MSPRLMPANPVRPAFFRFLADLEKHNDREWFKANQERFEEDVREPARALIRAVDPYLARLSRHLVADDSKVGGSLLRIQRDTRFSRDKTPYKTSVGMRFHHAEGRESGTAPGFYLGLSTKGVHVGAGLWRPSPAVQNQVRAAIVADAAGWKRAAHGKRFRETFDFEGESLKRPPRGFPAEHPLVEDLKRKDFVGFRELPKSAATQPDFVGVVAAHFKTATPFVRFLCEGLGLEF